MRLATALFTWIGSLFLYLPSNAQVPGDSTAQHLQEVPAQYAAKVQAKAQSIDEALTKKTDKYLNKLSRLENKILGKLQRLDPSKLQTLAPSSYDKWLGQTPNSITTPSGTTGATSAAAPGTYVPGLDTLKTTLSFLQQQPGAVTNATGQLSSASAQVNQLQGNLNQANLVDQYIQQRRQQLSQVLSQYSNLPSSITNTFNQYKETAYYYRQQVQAYKDMLSDPDKIEATTVSVLSRVPAYQLFLSHNSFLASLFSAPPGGGSAPGILPASLTGLQTRSQVQQVIQQQMAAGGASAQQAAAQQMQAAQSQLANLKQQISQYGSSGGGMDLPPGFSPNSQKTKTLLKRLEYGINVQFAQSTNFVPSTANVGVTLGYKLNDKSTIGTGLAYTAGMGTGWNHIQFSNQAIGLRSFMDWKIKKSYYVVGGYEENYMTQFSSIADLKNVDAWEKSLLIGLERKYKISAKLQGNVQVLYDALYSQQIPRGQMIKFRFGYNF